MWDVKPYTLTHRHCMLASVSRFNCVKIYATPGVKVDKDGIVCM